MHSKSLSLCLPKGDAMKALGGYFLRQGFVVEGYTSQNRTYRAQIPGLPVRAKIMAEKDVVIQVAAGNYDVGFCGLDWVREHTVKYRAAPLQVVQRLGLQSKRLFACASACGDLSGIDQLRDLDEVTIVSEYQNLAEQFAIDQHLKRFRIFSAWGSVEAYPPEHADVVILAAEDENHLHKDLLGLTVVLESDICLVVNRKSYVALDLSMILKYFTDTKSE